MQLKTIIATACIICSSSLFAQEKKPSKVEQKPSSSQQSTLPSATKPAKPPQKTNVGNAQPISTKPISIPAKKQEGKINTKQH